MQTPAQPVPAPERFKQKVDYKYNGLYIMRYLSRLINTVDRLLIMSTPLLNHLIQLRYQALGGFHFAYYWSNSRPPGLLTAGHILTRLILGDHANRTGLAGPFLKNHDNIPGRDSDIFDFFSAYAPPTIITLPPLYLFHSFLHSELPWRYYYVRSYAYNIV